MRELGQENSTQAGRASRPERDERRFQQAGPLWQRYVRDSILSLTGIALVTIIIANAHLYPRLPSSPLTYLLVIVVLASTRGRYAAILAALLASIAFDFFLAPLSDTLSFTVLDDLLDPLVFLITAILTGLLAALLRRHLEQAKSRESEIRLLAEQAQELAVLRERQRLARELHDSVSQALYGISLGAHTAREALEDDPKEAIAPLEYVIALTEAGLAEMRALIFELQPESIATEGVVAALDRQASILRARYKLSVDVQLCEEPDLSLERKQACYRIAREALHNIIKHAHARTVLLHLSRQGEDLILEICDDGEGFDPTLPYPGHFGLKSIQERAASLGGTCAIESAPAQGTCLRVRFPIPNPSGSAVEEGNEP